MSSVNMITKAIMVKEEAADTYPTCGYNVSREEAGCSPNIIIPYNKGKTNKQMAACCWTYYPSIL